MSSSAKNWIVNQTQGRERESDDRSKWRRISNRITRRNRYVGRRRASGRERRKKEKNNKLYRRVIQGRRRKYHQGWYFVYLPYFRFHSVYITVRVLLSTCITRDPADIYYSIKLLKVNGNEFTTFSMRISLEWVCHAWRDARSPDEPMKPSPCLFIAMVSYCSESIYHRWWYIYHLRYVDGNNKRETGRIRSSKIDFVINSGYRSLVLPLISNRSVLKARTGQDWHVPSTNQRHSIWVKVLDWKLKWSRCSSSRKSMEIFPSPSRSLSSMCLKKQNVVFEAQMNGESVTTCSKLQYN